ncbi:MAG: EMC3/TMCO1 family protein [Nanoarchaeota archaeon]
MVVEMVSGLLDPILSPILYLDPLLSIILVSLIISLGITFAHRKITDQKKMKELKGEIKKHQENMKSLKDKPDELMKEQKKAMEVNMTYMKNSLKPMLFTFLPIILVFGWLHANMAYFPLVEDEPFNATIYFEETVEGSITLDNGHINLVSGERTQQINDNKAEWVLSGTKGEYSITYILNGSEFSQDIIIVDSKSERKYAPPELTESNTPELKDLPIEKVVLSNERITPLQNVPLIGSIPWIGNFGWLGTYILFSIIFSLSLRKLLNIY